MNGAGNWGENKKFSSLGNFTSQAAGVNRHLVVVLNWAEELKRLVR